MNLTLKSDNVMLVMLVMLDMARNQDLEPLELPPLDDDEAPALHLEGCGPACHGHGLSNVPRRAKAKVCSVAPKAPRCGAVNALQRVAVGVQSSVGRIYLVQDRESEGGDSSK